MKFVLHFHPSPAWCLSPTAEGADSCTCVTYSHLSDDKFLCQNVGLGSSTQAQHGRRSVGDEGDADHPTAWGGQHRKCPRTFSVHKTNYRLYIYSETDHSPLLKALHRSSSKIINKINCLVGSSPQLDLSPVNSHHAGLGYFAPLYWYIAIKHIINLKKLFALSSLRRPDGYL